MCGLGVSFPIIILEFFGSPLKSEEIDSDISTVKDLLAKLISLARDPPDRDLVNHSIGRK